MKISFSPIMALLLSATVVSGGTNTVSRFDTLKGQYETVAAQAGNALLTRSQEALNAYGKGLTTAMDAFQKQGKLDEFLAVQAEKKRFDSEKTVPEPAGKPGDADVDKLIDAYKKTVDAARTDQAKSLLALKQRYAASLDRLIKELMLAKDFEQAKLVNEESKRIKAEVAAVQPASSSNSEEETARPGSRSASSRVPPSLQRGLVLYYTFDGNAANAMSADCQGVVEGATLTADRFGKADSAFHFSGDGAHINLGIGNPVKNNKGTISAWIKFETRPQLANWYIFAKGNDAAGGGSYALMLGSADGSARKMEAIVMTAASGANWTRSLEGQMHEGKWHHVAGVIDEHKASIFIDGKFCGSSIFNGPLPETERPLWIGGQARPGYGYFFKGCIDDVAVYDRPLSKLEVGELYRLQSSGKWLIQPATMANSAGVYGGRKLIP